MKISSKSILSPGRAGVRDPPNLLSTSLSRRLKNSGSVRGGASPAMFPTTARKRGSFENPEPSSPKVTCIGQVRVRGKKKQAKKLRTLSRRHNAGDVSLRKIEHPVNEFASKDYNRNESLNLGSNGSQNHQLSGHQSQNQECSPALKSWVHFPVTICEALRTFGSEFSCLIPCRTERGKEEKTVAADDGCRRGSCGAVFTRWLVAVQDGDGGGRRDIELVVGDEEEGEDEDEDEDEEESVVRRPRRHVFEDLEIIDGRIEGHQDEARVSVCIPPKNALLLMRCRSDPMKNETLTNRSWEPIVTRNDEEDEEFVDCEDQIEKDSKEQQQIMGLDQNQENVQQDEANQDQELDNVQLDEANQDQELDNVQLDKAYQDQELDNVKRDELGQDQEHENLQQVEMGQDQERANVQEDEVGQDQERANVQQDDMGQDQEHGNVLQDDLGQDQEHRNVLQDEVGQDKEREHEQTEVEEEESFHLVSLFEEITNQDYEIEEHDNDKTHDEEDYVGETVAEISETHEKEMVNQAEDHNNGVLERESDVRERSEQVLPECLLLMIHEPKLSLNVSKETWVCSTDFKRPSSRRKPPAPPPPIKPAGEDESTVGGTATVNDMMTVADGGFPAVLPQPARSSCSLPMAPSMATVLEQKLANAVGYEPFVLTRCKSEPMKTAAAKLLPESCVWENRKLERLSRGSFRAGAAGLGF